MIDPYILINERAWKAYTSEKRINCRYVKRDTSEGTTIAFYIYKTIISLHYRLPSEAWNPILKDIED